MHSHTLMMELSRKCFAHILYFSARTKLSIVFIYIYIYTYRERERERESYLKRTMVYYYCITDCSFRYTPVYNIHRLSSSERLLSTFSADVIPQCID